MKNRASKATQFPWFRVSFFMLACAILVMVTGSVFHKIRKKLKSEPAKTVQKTVADNPPKQVKKTPAVKPVKPPVAKPPVVVRKPVQPKPITHHLATSGGDIRRMSKGFTLKTKFTVDKNGDLASKVRKRKDAYVATYELKVTLPKPSDTLESLETVSPRLGEILPGLKDAMPKAQVSSFFYQAYNNKVKRIRAKMASLGELMTQHNFYDCETILNLKHPKTGRRVLLLQSEMDVVSDGSDGDRLPKMPKKITHSSYYQPMTSYGWKKTGKTPNPLIEGWRSRIQKANEEIARKGTSASRKAWLRARIKKIKREIQDMQYRSYLIAEYDPFIVMPINMITSKSDPYAPKVGDYAVVIYKGKVYPTIVGDAGPSFKTGEASLRIAKQLNARAGIYSRPVSDLTVTYLVFPGSAEKAKAPDYAYWKTKCEELLADFGGLGENVSLFTWKNTLPPIKPKTEPKKESQTGTESKKEGADAIKGDDSEKKASDEKLQEKPQEKSDADSLKSSDKPTVEGADDAKEKVDGKADGKPEGKADEKSEGEENKEPVSDDGEKKTPETKSPSMPLPPGVTVE